MKSKSGEKPVSVGIAGVTGYAGQELLKLLLGHPRVEVTYLANSGKTDPGPVLRHFGTLPARVTAFNPEECAKACDTVFLCLPHKASMDSVPALLGKGIKVLDLSADFRIKDKAVYEAAYGITHSAPSLLKKAVYGQAELHGAELAGASLVAVPGCYPTGAILAMAPLLKGRLTAGKIVIDSKSGVTGAGREMRADLMFCEVNESVRAYGVFKHRHAPEIGQEMAALLGTEPEFTFTPHLIPMNRGILTTVNMTLKRNATTEELTASYALFYKKNPFVRVLDGALPETRAVRGTNFCDIAVVARDRDVIAISAIDNLVKGAAGQAVQAFNLSAGFPEAEGLLAPAGAP